MTKMTKGDRFARIIADLTVLHDAAPEGSNERLQWEISIYSIEAARKMGEGKFIPGFTQARKAAAMVAGH